MLYSLDDFVVFPDFLLFIQLVQSFLSIHHNPYPGILTSFHPLMFAHTIFFQYQLYILEFGSRWYSRESFIVVPGPLRLIPEKLEISFDTLNLSKNCHLKKRKFNYDKRKIIHWIKLILSNLTFVLMLIEFIWPQLSFQIEVSFLFILNFDSFNTNFFLTFFNSVQADIFRTKTEFRQEFTVVLLAYRHFAYTNGRFHFWSWK